MDQLPDWQYRLLFALARWGGMRVPSELAKMTWGDVDWKRMRLTVHSLKTEHHEGHERCVIPLFPELVQPLQEVTGFALRKPQIKTTLAAGVEQWPSLWVALRATRDMELRETYPVHVCEAWLGHEDRVAKRNYTQVTEEHFQQAASEKTNGESGAESGADSDGIGSQDSEAQKTNPDICRGLPHLETVYNSLGGDDRNRTCTP